MESTDARSEATAKRRLDDVLLRVLHVELLLGHEIGRHEGRLRVGELGFEPVDLSAEEDDRLAGRVQLLGVAPAKQLPPASDFLKFTAVHGAIMSCCARNRSGHPWMQIEAAVAVRHAPRSRGLRWRRGPLAMSAVADDGGQRDASTQ